MEPHRAEHCRAAGAAYDAHGAGALAEIARRLASAPLADGLVERWQPSTPLLVVAALRYLSDAGVPDPATAGDPDAVLEAGQARRDAVREFVRTHRVQFTEPLRSSLLLPGVLLAARDGGRPLRLIEIGAGAGLLLAFDRYRHVFPTGAWGPQGAALTLTSPLPVPPDLLDTDLEVVDRIGIDLAPLNVRDPSHVKLMRAFAWTGPPEREQRLVQACRATADQPVRLLAGDAIDRLPEVLARSSPDVTTVVIESGTLNQLDALQRMRLLGRMAVAGRRIPLLVLARPGGDPGPLSTRLSLGQVPARAPARTYAHADVLGEGARWHGPDDAAFDALSRLLGPAGQWKLTMAPIGAGDDAGQTEITPCLTALGMLALAESDDERADALRARSARHLEQTVQGPSLWRYYRDTPCDSDSTSLAAGALGPDHPLMRRAPSTDTLLDNRTSHGLFRTWLHARGDPDAQPMLDVTVNAHVVAALGDRDETRAAIEWIRDSIDSGTETANSWYYRDPLHLHWATQRAVNAGSHSLAQAAETAAARAAGLLVRQAQLEQHRLALATLVATWGGRELAPSTARWVATELRKAQRVDGTWPAGVIYVGVAPPGEPTVEFRSTALSTALCVAALLRVCQ